MSPSILHFMRYAVEVDTPHRSAALLMLTLST